VTVMVTEFERRRNRIVHELNGIPGVDCLMPQGAFYVFPDFSSFYGRSYEGKVIASSSDLSGYLLEKANVAVVPGIEFGQDDYIRISYAISLEQIVEGLERIKRAVSGLY